MNFNESEARAFIRKHVEQIRPLLLASNRASWEAATTGSEEALRKSAEARAAFKRVYGKRDGFDMVRRLLATGEIDDPLVHRQLVLLDHSFTGNQLPPETIEDLSHRESDLERTFYNFRAKFDGADYSNNELREMLQRETDSDRRRRMWEASKAVGPVIEPYLKELVRRRNQAARELGFDDFYSMELSLQEIDQEELFDLLDDFRERSDDAYADMRERIDLELADRHGVALAALRPWHWDDFFCQDAPVVAGIDLDPIFASRDLAALARDYYGSLQLPVEDVLERSDLYEREGKDQHAFCIDIDREGDVRTLCNLRPDERWMRTLLHELGHAVYDKFIPRDLPFLLRGPAHTLSTESIAMFFGRLTRDPSWLRATAGHELDAAREAEVREQQRRTMLISARWMLVMIHFERALYENPDREDLNRLWWDLVEEYQKIRRPDDRDAPDWATKIHLSLAPVYYHNYLLGELMASQVTHSIEGSAAPIGAFLRDRIFARGATLAWNDLLVEATGEPLSPRFFVEQFVA